MDRAEAIRKIEYRLEMETSEPTSFGQLTVVRTDALKVALAALREQEQREQEPKGVEIDTVKNEWVSVKERLPKGENGSDFCENVIAFTSEGQVTTGWLNGDVWFLLVGDLDHHTKHGRRYVTHWMPLPMPPKEGAEREQEQREQGCEVCKGITSISGAFNGTGPGDENHLLCVDYDGDFDFCPMCGRKLEEGV